MLRDGYQMAQKGRAGAALAVAAVGSFVAGRHREVGAAGEGGEDRTVANGRCD
jgi:hypothetical protein